MPALQTSQEDSNCRSWFETSACLCLLQLPGPIVATLWPTWSTVAQGFCPDWCSFCQSVNHSRLNFETDLWLEICSCNCSECSWRRELSEIQTIVGRQSTRILHSYFINFLAERRRNKLGFGFGNVSQSGATLARTRISGTQTNATIFQEKTTNTRRQLI